MITAYKKARLFLVFLLVFAGAAGASASLAPIDLGVHTSGDSTVDQYLYHREGFSERFELEDILALEDWTVPGAGEVNHGFSYTPVWMKFQLRNPSQQQASLILEYVDANAEVIDAYSRRLGSEQSFKHQQFVFNQPVSTRPVSFYRPAFEVDVPGSASVEVYVKIFQGNDFPMHSFTSMRIWDEDDFYRMGDVELLMLVVLLCAEIFMGLATLVAFVSTREKLFLYYACFAFSGALLFSGLSGVWGYFISPDGYELWQVVFQISLCQIAAVLFVRKFLRTDIHMPWVDALLLGMVWIDIIGVILNLSGSPYFSRIIIDHTAFAYLLLLPIGFYAHKKGVEHALLFTSSWVVFIVGMTLASLRYRGYIGDSFWTEWLIYVGGFVEIFLLSTIMVFRIRDMQREKLEIERSHRQLLRDSADQLAIQVEDKTQELKDAKEAAEHEARIDVLTGITNRRSFFEMAEQYIARAKRNGNSGLYLLMVDLDHFKKINDSLGHAAGDEVLIQVTAAMSQSIRDIDLLSRLGGEEFAVLVEDDSMQGATEFAERLRQCVEDLKIEFEDDTIAVTISVGIADWSEGDTLHHLMSKADRALYKAKQQGRNQVEISLL